MNKDLEMTLALFVSIVILGFGMSFLIVGRELYGSDASILWVSGMLSWMAIVGICNFIIYLTNRNNKEKRK